MGENKKVDIYRAENFEGVEVFYVLTEEVRGELVSECESEGGIWDEWLVDFLRCEVGEYLWEWVGTYVREG